MCTYLVNFQKYNENFKMLNNQKINSVIVQTTVLNNEKKFFFLKFLNFGIYSKNSTFYINNLFAT